MTPVLFLILKLTSSEESGFCRFTGRYNEGQNDTEFYAFRDSSIIASRNSLEELLAYLNMHYEFRYAVIDMAEVRNYGK